MISGKAGYIAAMAMLLVGLLADTAFAHNPWGVEAFYTYAFQYSFAAMLIIAFLVLLIVAALQLRTGKNMGFIDAAAVLCAAAGGGVVALGLTSRMLLFLSQAFYLNYGMYVLCAAVQTLGSLSGAAMLYFTSMQGRKLCFIEIAAILLAAFGSFRIVAKLISMIISHPPESGRIQIALLAGCFIPGAVAAGLAVLQGRRVRMASAEDAGNSAREGH